MDAEMDDRFDLETAIINLHSTADDINLLAEAVLEGEMTPDDIANTLIGISALTHLRADKAFEAYKATFKLDEYREDAAVV